MTSAARRGFIEALDALEGACDVPNVLAQDAIGRFLRKGLTVAAYNTLEGFLSERWSELANYANSGHTQFRDLPDQMKQKTVHRTINGAREELRRSSMTLSEEITFASGVGSSLSAVTGGLQFSPLVGKWQGSNITSEEIIQMLRMWHVASPWKTILDVTAAFGYSSRSGTGAMLDLDSEFRTLTRTRNEAAHAMGFSITSLQLRTIPAFIARVGFGIDVLMSAAISRLHGGDRSYLEDDKSVSLGSLECFKVVRRKKDYALYRLPSARAQRVASDGDLLFNSACAGVSPGQVVVRLNEVDKVLDWSIGGPG